MRKLLRILGLMLALALSPSLVGAQTGQTEEFPQRTISMIVPFALGSASDLTLRLIADFMRELTSVGMLANSPVVLVVDPKLPIHSSAS